VHAYAFGDLHTMEADGDRPQPIHPSPPCYNCHRRTIHCIRVADPESGDHFDIFQCANCEAITWSPPLPKHIGRW
jgi:hypothetical protein